MKSIVLSTLTLTCWWGVYIPKYRQQGSNHAPPRHLPGVLKKLLYIQNNWMLQHEDSKAWRASVTSHEERRAFVAPPPPISPTCSHERDSHRTQLLWLPTAIRCGTPRGPSGARNTSKETCTDNTNHCRDYGRRTPPAIVTANKTESSMTPLRC